MQNYKLIIDLETRGSLAPDLQKIGGAGEKVGATLGKIGSLASSAASGIAGAFTSAVESVGAVAAGMAKIGAVAAGGAITYGIVSLNNQLEQTKTSLGSIFNAQLGGGMAANLNIAGNVVRDMRKDAAQLPGEFKDLLGFMRMGSTPGLQAGASITQMEKLSANAMAAAASTGIDMATASREFGMLLQGRAGAHNVFGTMLGLTGDRAEAFNKSSGDDKLKTLEKELGKYQPAIEHFATTFDALSSTMIDNGKSVLMKATAPVFGAVKNAMMDLNSWYDRNEERVMAFAEKVGTKLHYAFELGRQKILEWGPYLISFAENGYNEIVGIWRKVEPYVERLGQSLQKALSDPKTFERLEGVLKLYGMVKIGQMASPAVSGIGSLLGGGGLAGLGSVGELAVAAPVAVAALSAFGMATYGIVDTLSDSENVFHDFASGLADNMGKSVASINSKLGPGGLGGVLQGASDVLGVSAMSMASNWLYTIDLAVTGVSKFTDAIISVGARINKFLGIGQNPDEKPGAPPKEYRDVLGILRTEKDDADGGKRRSVAGGGGTSIQKVEIVVSSNQDPSRIARAVADKLVDVGRNPTSSRYVRNWGAARP